MKCYFPITIKFLQNVRKGQNNLDKKYQKMIKGKNNKGPCMNQFFLFSSSQILV